MAEVTDPIKIVSLLIDAFVLQKPDHLLSAAHLSSLPVFREGPQTSQQGQPLQSQNLGKAEQVVTAV